MLLVACLVQPVTAATGQPQRPIPHPVVAPPNFQRAIENGTRTTRGLPGERIWQNRASYQIEAVLSPATNRLTASGRLTYTNNSPAFLDRLYLHLRQNLHRPDAIRTRTVPITGGLNLSRVAVEGLELVNRPTLREPGYHVSGTTLRVELPEALPPGESVRLDLAWSFEVPGLGTPRMGQDGEVYLLAYWYPQMAVYDDVNGWDLAQYLGLGEFYMGFGDYDVRITLPAGWLVSATGTLENPDEVLPPWVRARLDRARSSSEVVRVVTPDERDSATVASATGTNTWQFAARNVRDFAFGTSNRYVWDATAARLPDGGTVAAHAFYRPDAAGWEITAEYIKWSVETISARITPYPYPQMSAVEGLISGGMEYPMLTLVGGTRTPASLFRVTFHEVAHVWYPMLVASNEHESGWMDEGLVSLLSEDANEAYWADEAIPVYPPYYHRVAGTGQEREMMRPSEQFPRTGSARRAALYGKPVVMLRTLREIVGEERFWTALREYTQRWTHRHPEPYDFFNTFEDVLDEDLDWFWSSIFFETWTMDHAIAGVDTGPNAVRVDVADQDLLPMPAVVRVTYRDGRTEEQVVPVEHWLAGATTAELLFPGGAVEQIELDSRRQFPDLNRENDVWRPEEGARR